MPGVDRLRGLTLLSLTILMIFSLTTLAPSVVRGGGNPWVATFREDGLPSDVFNKGEKVNITAYSSNPLPYEVIVKDSDGLIRYTDKSYTPRYSKVVSDITDKLGWWEVEAGSATTHYASAWYTVIPEVPLGTIAVLLAGFTAALIKRRKY